MQIPLIGPHKSFKVRAHKVGWWSLQSAQGKGRKKHLQPTDNLLWLQRFGACLVEVQRWRMAPRPRHGVNTSPCRDFTCPRVPPPLIYFFPLCAAAIQQRAQRWWIMKGWADGVFSSRGSAVYTSFISETLNTRAAVPCRMFPVRTVDILRCLRGSVNWAAANELVRTPAEPRGSRLQCGTRSRLGSYCKLESWRRACARVGDEWLLLIHLVRRKVIHRPACGWRRMPSPWKPAACLHVRRPPH